MKNLSICSKMDLLPRHLLILLMMLWPGLPVFAQAQENFTILNYKDLQNLLKSEVILADNAHLRIMGFSLNNKQVDDLLQMESIGRVTRFTLMHTEMYYESFIKLLSGLEEGNLQRYHLHYLRTKEGGKAGNKAVLTGLAEIDLQNVDLPEEFYRRYKGARLPDLQSLTLDNCGLDSDFLQTLESWNILPQLKSLNLSNNKLGNKVLSLLKRDVPGKLEVLKLNNCDFMFVWEQQYRPIDLEEKPEKMMEDFRDMDWGTRFLGSLRQLELQQEEQNSGVISTLLENPVLARLPVFLPPLHKAFSLKFLKITYDTDKPERILFDRVEELRKLFARPIGSTRNNYRFINPAYLQLFLESPQAAQMENLTLAGGFWQEDGIRAVLELVPDRLPNLKEVELFRTSISQREALTLLNDFPGLTFNMNLTFDFNKGLPEHNMQSAEYWPRIYIKEK